MQFERVRSVSGHVFRVDRKAGPVWYAKYRLPDGRQVQKRLGPAWTQRGRPAGGYLTKRTAEAWLRDVLAEARAGTLPGIVRTGATFAAAAAEWLRYDTVLIDAPHGLGRLSLDDHRGRRLGDRPARPADVDVGGAVKLAELIDQRLRRLQPAVRLLGVLVCQVDHRLDARASRRARAPTSAASSARWLGL